jgi:hypothetical protein
MGLFTKISTTEIPKDLFKVQGNGFDVRVYSHAYTILKSDLSKFKNFMARAESTEKKEREKRRTNVTIREFTDIDGIEKFFILFEKLTYHYVN